MKTPPDRTTTAPTTTAAAASAPSRRAVAGRLAWWWLTTVAAAAATLPLERCGAFRASPVARTGMSTAAALSRRRRQQQQRSPPPFSSPFSLALSSSLVDIDESAYMERDVGTFDEWSYQCGVQRCDGVQIATEDGLDFGMMTTEPIAQNSPVLFVPAPMVLSADAVRAELGEYCGPAQELLTRLLGAADEASIQQFYLFVRVLMEYERGTESPWYPWLNALPKKYDNGASMTPYCYECLPPLVAKLASENRVKFLHFHESLKQLEFLSPETKADKDLTKWAYNTVVTRSFDSGLYGPETPDLRIAPVADMFNHGTETEVALSYDEEGNCMVYATRDVEPGSPLRMSYGDPTNPSHLFATYGFLDETSPATFCKIMIRPNDELRNLGYDYSRLLFYKDTGDVSEEVWDVLLYRALDFDRDEQKAFYDAHMRGDYETKNAYHQQYFLETAGALKNHVDNFLEQLEELSAKALTKDVNEHPRIPLILAHNEFVKETFLTVKQQIDPLVEQAVAQAAATSATA